MKKFAPELDELMWYLAEDGTSQSVEEFEQRYPEFRYELARRMSLVRQLKGEGRKVHRTLEVPAFQPVHVRPVPQSRRMVFGVAALSLAAIAAATFTVVSFMQPAAVVPPQPVEVPKPVPPIVANQNAEESPPPIVTPESPPRTATAERAAPPVDTTPSYLKPQNVKIEKAPLVSALKLIAAQGGLELVIAPDMPDPIVDVSFEGTNTIEMLKDLGRQYAFTAFDQGDGTVLIIPAVDPSVGGGNKPERFEMEPNDTSSSGRKVEKTRAHEP